MTYNKYRIIYDYKLSKLENQYNQIYSLFKEHTKYIYEYSDENSIDKTVFKYNIYLDVIQELVDNKKVKDELDFNSIVELRLARKNELVKILGRGELKAKIKVTAHKFTASAKSAIEAAGGEAVTL